MITFRLSRAVGVLLVVCACATVPKTTHKKHKFPENGVFLGEPPVLEPGRTFKVIGAVKAHRSYRTFDFEGDSQALCRNYFNLAAHDLLRFAREQKADAVIRVKSVTLGLDGKVSLHDTPECADDLEEGEINLYGEAIRFDPDPKKPVD